MNRLKQPLTVLTTLLLATCIALAGATLFAAPASALPVIGHGYGHTWSADDRSWLGTHRLADGNLGLCLQVQYAPPEGADAVYRVGNPLGWVAADDAARLAYLARVWSQSADPDTAAAAQLATWAITGFGAHDAGWYAQRANGSAGAVLARAASMRQRMDAPGGASRGVTAKLSLAVPSDAGGTVSNDLVVDYLGGGPAKLAPHTHTGQLTLSGATFADGTSTRRAWNGESLPITPSAGTALSDVTADISFTDLPYDSTFYVAKAPSGIQSLLVPPPPGGIAASAHAHAGDVSPLPFAPAVQTQTGRTEAEVGSHLVDSLELGLAKVPKLAADSDEEVPVQAPVPASAERTGPVGADLPADGEVPAGTTELLPPTTLVPPTTLNEWGVYRDGDGALQPVPVVIRSTLWGPFDKAPVRQASVPPGARAACRVEVHAEDGPGPYETPDCVLAAAGYYVWTETIDPADTPTAQGGDRITPWASPFGVSTEVTLAVTPPPLPPVTETPRPTPPPNGTTTPVPSTTPGVVSPPASPPAHRGETSLASTGSSVGAVAPWLGLGAAGLALGTATLLGTRAAQRARRRRL